MKYYIPIINEHHEYWDETGQEWVFHYSDATLYDLDVVLHMPYTHGYYHELPDGGKWSLKEIQQLPDRS